MFFFFHKPTTFLCIHKCLTPLLISSPVRVMASPYNVVMSTPFSKPIRKSKTAPGPNEEVSSQERRKRNCTKKTRTGCLTCKKRRVKCDEHFPQCWNCLKSKERVCEGYTSFRQDGLELDTTFQIHLETSMSSQTPASSTKNTSRDSLSNFNAPSSSATTPASFHPPQSSPRWREGQYTPPSSSSSDRHGEEPSYFLHKPHGFNKSPYTGVGFAAPILTSPVSDSEGSCTLAPLHTDFSRIDYSYGEFPRSATICSPDEDSKHIVAQTPDAIFNGPARPQEASRENSTTHLGLIHEPTTPSLPMLRYALDSSPFSRDAQSAHSFSFYMTHSGAAMGARSSDLFFLYTLPQVAFEYDYVRYALLATSLVDESVDDTYTDKSKQGPGIECVNIEARRLSFEMYGRSLRALCDAQSIQHATFRDSDNALAAALITCILLFSFENWLWNVQNASRHIDGARELIGHYERTPAGQARRPGLLQDQVLVMLRSSISFHEMSVKYKMPASRCTEGAIWAPETPLVVS